MSSSSAGNGPRVKMSPVALDLLERRMAHLRENHQNLLLKAHSDVVKAIDVKRRNTVATALDLMRSETQKSLGDYCRQVRAEVMKVAEQTTLQLSLQDADAILERVARQFDADIHVKRFDVFCESTTRHFARAGAVVDLSAFRPDLGRALLHAGTSNAITQFLSSLRDEVELLVHRHRIAAEADDQRDSAGVPRWMTRWKFWLGAVGVVATVVGVVATVASAYRSYAPADKTQQASLAIAASEPTAARPASVASASVSPAAAIAGASAATSGTAELSAPRPK